MIMLFCTNCNKEVVPFSVPFGAMTDDEIESQRAQVEGEGKLLLFNPPPFPPYSCPACMKELENR